ncbi:MBL fold metallo-hydrolase [Aureivirga marina]|uniref:peptidase n=1 Tax=Aureivirga marina TaxID=1182451 RepID=UPI0018CA3691|nr:peptidase [Aureivirga marina]
MFTPELKNNADEDISVMVKVSNYSGSFICECGDASNLTIKDCHETEAIFISHTHIDHFINFDTILRHQLGIQKRIVICGPKDIAKQVQAKILGFTWNLIQENAIAYEIREIIDENTIDYYELIPPTWELKKLKTVTSEKIYKTKKFEVDFTILDHKTPSIAYLFKEFDTVKLNIKDSGFKGGIWARQLKEAFDSKNENQEIEIEGTTYFAKDLFHLLERKQGDSFGIIMDHAANSENHEKIKNLFSETNQVYIEAFYKEEDKEAAILNFHSYASASAKIMKECEVKNPTPVHYSRKYNADEVEELRNEFYKALQ